jgi:hypothetical protein
MSNNDPLLQFLSEDASSDQPATSGYKISVVIGGVLFRGYVQHPGSFLEELLPDELASAYRARGVPRDASNYLHLLAEEGPGISNREKRHVRFPMDGIDAWWAE